MSTRRSQLAPVEWFVDQPGFTAVDGKTSEPRALPITFIGITPSTTAKRIAMTKSGSAKRA